MSSSKSPGPLDVLQKQHETFSKEIIDCLIFYYSNHDMIYSEEYFSIFEFTSSNIVLAVVTIAYLFRHESRRLFDALADKLNDVEKFKAYCMLIPVIRNDRYFYNYLRRISLISELAMYCFRGSKDYFSVACQCIADYQDVIYFQSSGGWSRLDEISSFLKDLGAPFYSLFDHPIAKESQDFKKMVLLLESDATIRNDTDLLDSNEMQMLKVIRNNFIFYPRKVLTENHPDIIPDFNRNLKGKWKLLPDSSQETKFELKDEKKAIIKYFERCLIPRILAKYYENVYLSENMSLSDSTRRIGIEEMTTSATTNKSMEKNASYIQVLNKKDNDIISDHRPIMNTSTSTEYKSSTNSEVSHDSSSDESSDTVVSGCLSRRKLINALIKKRKMYGSRFRRSYKTFGNESLNSVEEQLLKIPNSKYSKDLACKVRLCKKKIQNEACCVDESLDESQELQETKYLPALEEHGSYASKQYSENYSLQAFMYVDPDTETKSNLSDKSMRTGTSPNINPLLATICKIKIQSLLENMSQGPYQIYSSSGSSITSENEHSGHTAVEREGLDKIQSSEDYTKDLDDLTEIVSQVNGDHQFKIHENGNNNEPCLSQNIQECLRKSEEVLVASVVNGEEISSSETNSEGSPRKKVNYPPKRSRKKKPKKRGKKK